MSGGFDFMLGGSAGLSMRAWCAVSRGCAKVNGSDIRNQSLTLMLGYYLGR